MKSIILSALFILSFGASNIAFAHQGNNGDKVLDLYEAITRYDGKDPTKGAKQKNKQFMETLIVDRNAGPQKKPSKK